MQIGAVYPQIEVGDDPGAAKAFAQAIEELGYHHILAFDHVVGANSKTHKLKGIYTSDDAFLEPLVMFAWMAAVTERIDFTTGILIAPQRQTVLIAKQAATLDFLSRGRLRLGIGIGWNDVEYEALRQDFKNRGKRSEEQIILMRKLWTEPLVTLSGQWEKITDAGILPLPKQQPIPIWLGGHSDATLRRAAKLADGWIPLFPPDDKGRSEIEKFYGYLKSEDRKPSEFGIESWINIGNYDDGFGAQYTTEAEWLKWSQAWKSLGASHISVNTMMSGFKTVDEHINKLAHFIQVVNETL